MFFAPHTTRYTAGHRSPATRGLTLVEMLISMAVTLIMMAAVVNLFANIGTGVRNRNASMELGGELRTARARLFKDLAGATCAARPKLPSDDHDDGYIELIEGQFSDKFPSQLVNGIDNGTDDLELDFATSIVPSAGDPSEIASVLATANAVTNGGGLGDYDDILALTVRSESEPFVGQALLLQPKVNATDPDVFLTETIESDLAEIIWYSVENPADGSLGEPGMRTVYRRILLIAPWLSGRFQTPIGNTISSPADMLDFYRRNDVSIRRELIQNNAGVVTGSVWVPNTLSDLTKRQHRFAHSLDSNPTPGDPTPGFGFPYVMDQSAIRAVTYDSATPPLARMGPLRPYGEPFDNDPESEERKGEDIMLNDVLAFDLRVFDPQAQLVQVAGAVTEPADAGWRYEPSVTFPVVGEGAFVDLNYWGLYDTYIDVIGLGNSGLASLPGTVHPNPTLFSDIPAARSYLNTPAAIFPSVTYDTWSYHYENDGLDQDNGISTIETWRNFDDQGTDGLDNDNANGVDDPGERETAPPYDTPLRGIQVKLRVYDRDSRQIREATVTRNFVPQ